VTRLLAPIDNHQLTFWRTLLRISSESYPGVEKAIACGRARRFYNPASNSETACRLCDADGLTYPVDRAVVPIAPRKRQGE